EPGLLHTTCQWGNYQLTLEFRADEATNSGVFLRTPPVVTDVARRAYEVNIAPADNPFPTGSLVERLRSAEDTSGQGWRTMDITADGPRVTVAIDGREVLDYTDPKPLGRGYIGLQFNQGKIEFRNVKLRPLGMKPIFNDRDLSGWKTFPNVKSVFGVTTDGELSVKDGPGQIETAGQYGDFTLQLDVFVRGRGLNSGVFFRCIPGEPMNGYESQIHNGFVGGDRTKPVDCGTGGIFRRANARYVVADDFEWITKTIHVDGPRMAVWVNGYQVTDWTDTRKPDPNPRRGLRLEPGTVQIQGHDPTTDLLFRNLRIAELPKR
ncbi:MAG: DUF1080 domain-containing protein, partial [Pirellulaceae bacterium]|nr:DUF1080 domain-containing protein [Pirellulaceae bacterium]